MRCRIFLDNSRFLLWFWRLFSEFALVSFLPSCKSSFSLFIYHIVEYLGIRKSVSISSNLTRSLIKIQNDDNTMTRNQLLYLEIYPSNISLFFREKFLFLFLQRYCIWCKIVRKNNNNHNTSLFIPNNAHLHISVVCRDRLLPFKLLISDVLQKFEIFWIFVSRCVSQTNSNAHIEWYMLWLSFLFFSFYRATSVQSLNIYMLEACVFYVEHNVR